LLLIRDPLILHDDRLRFTMAGFLTTAPNVPLPLPKVGFAPWSIAGASQAPFAFVASTAGDLYALDLGRNGASFVHFGRHQDPFPNVLACTDDAALVVAGNDTISCWDRAAARCLWKRQDCGINHGMFLAGTRRFFAVLITGQIVEFDGQSGATVYELPKPPVSTIYFDITPGTHRLAAVDANGACVVSSVGERRPLWSRQFHVPPATPRFSPDGEILIANNEFLKTSVALLSADTGTLLGELTGAKNPIVGLAITPQGAVYAWDISGTVTVWDLASRALLFQFRLEQFT
jgi:DNA-binding beta-propeller fold protein YncE